MTPEERFEAWWIEHFPFGDIKGFVRAHDAYLAATSETAQECMEMCKEGVKWTPNFPPNVQRVTDETCALLAKDIAKRYDL